MSLVKFSNQFPSIFDRFFENDLFDWSSRNFSSTNTTLPSVNIKESEEGFEVEMAAPGLSKKDFKIELNNDQLTISSEKEVEKETKEKEQFTRREFSYQSFQRSFTVAETAVDAEKIKANYKEGILFITLRGRTRARARLRATET